MTGFSIASQKAEEILKFPLKTSPYILGLTLILFVLLTITYLIKIFKFQDEVRAEFNHPIKLNFFPAFSISFLLISIAFLSINKNISQTFWIIGTVLHFFLTIKIISIWIQQTKFEIKHINPAWFIPSVGNIVIPVAGVSHFSPEISWFFFSVGFVFWVILLILFFNRIIFHNPLPEKLLPTLFILIAPPAIGFVSFVKLSGEVTIFSVVLYNIGLFLTFLLFAQFNIFSKIRYYLSWWAYSFPMSAITIASILMYHKSEIHFYKYLAIGFYSILVVIIIILLAKTFGAMSRKEICIMEE
jgi:tellurite resistance protein